MIRSIWLLTALTALTAITLNYTYADVTTRGANAYDWQTCVDSRYGECLNGCSRSEDIDCGDNCKSMSVDKCKSEGLIPS